MRKKTTGTGIENWSNKSINSFRVMMRLHCPNGMANACDGTPLERGKPWKEKCRYYHNGKCLEESIARSRKFAENAAGRHE